MTPGIPNIDIKDDAKVIAAVLLTPQVRKTVVNVEVHNNDVGKLLQQPAPLLDKIEPADPSLAPGLNLTDALSAREMDWSPVKVQLNNLPQQYLRLSKIRLTSKSLQTYNIYYEVSLNMKEELQLFAL